MVRERGSGKTPERVVELLTAEVQEKSILAVHKLTGIGLAAIGRYLKGIGEPTTATLQKLADYFGVSVAYLRGEQNPIRKIVGKDEANFFEKLSDDIIELYGTVPIKYKASLWSVMIYIKDDIENLLLRYVAGVEVENEKILNEALKKLNSALFRESNGEYRATDTDENGAVLFYANNPHHIKK